jgi:MFS family permease
MRSPSSPQRLVVANALIGERVGGLVGARVEGPLVGAFISVGPRIGTLVGAMVAGFVVGFFVGPFVGVLVGALVGVLVGAFDGFLVGAFVGALVGQTRPFSLPGVPLSFPLIQVMNAVDDFQFVALLVGARALTLDKEAPMVKGNSPADQYRASSTRA